MTFFSCHQDVSLPIWHGADTVYILPLFFLSFSCALYTFLIDDIASLAAYRGTESWFGNYGAFGATSSDAFMGCSFFSSFLFKHSVHIIWLVGSGVFPLFLAMFYYTPGSLEKLTMFLLFLNLLFSVFSSLMGCICAACTAFTHSPIFKTVKIIAQREYMPFLGRDFLV